MVTATTEQAPVTPDVATLDETLTTSIARRPEDRIKLGIEVHYPETDYTVRTAFERFNELEPTLAMNAIQDILSKRTDALEVPKTTPAHTAIQKLVYLTTRDWMPAPLGFENPEPVWAELFTNEAYRDARRTFTGAGDGAKKEAKEKHTLTTLWIISAINRGIQNPQAPTPGRKFSEYDLAA